MILLYLDDCFVVPPVLRGFLNYIDANGFILYIKLHIAVTSSFEV